MRGRAAPQDRHRIQDAADVHGGPKRRRRRRKKKAVAEVSLDTPCDEPVPWVFVGSGQGQGMKCLRVWWGLLISLIMLNKYIIYDIYKFSIYCTCSFWKKLFERVLGGKLSWWRWNWRWTLSLITCQHVVSSKGVFFGMFFLTRCGSKAALSFSKLMFQIGGFDWRARCFPILGLQKPGSQDRSPKKQVANLLEPCRICKSAILSGVFSN